MSGGRRRALPGLAAAGLVALALAGPAIAPRDPLTSLDPAALRLLPPGARVPALVGRDGTLIPIAGRDPLGDGEVVSEWSLSEGSVVYRRGPRMLTRPLTSLVLTESGEPRIETLTFPLGTDRFGRDLLSRLLAGARLSLGIGLLGVLGATALGGLLGLAAGLGRRPFDSLIGRVGDAFLSVPRVVLVMALAAIVRPGPWVLALLLAVTGWPSLTRLVRADVRSLAGSEMVAAARAAGGSGARIALVHVLPHAAATLLVAAGLRVGPFVLLEGSLSFLGFGVPPPHASWGNILGEGRDVLVEAWWITTIPGLLLGGTVIVVNAAADRLRAALQPRRARD